MINEYNEFDKMLDECNSTYDDSKENLNGLFVFLLIK